MEAKNTVMGFLDCIDYAIAYLIKDTIAEVEKELEGIKNKGEE